MTGPIVLLTDFGWSSYVGVMKGVILQLCPHAQIVDLTHNVSPQNIREGAWLLLTSYAFFPKGSIFLAVIDPGVGTTRKALAIKTSNYYFIGPDNGLLYPAAAEAGFVQTVELPIPFGASTTFHGRDVFAPAAAKLASGMPLHQLGVPATPEIQLTFHLQGRQGEIVNIDTFGNVVTNLPPIPNRSSYKVILESDDNTIETKLPFYSTYAAAPYDTLFVITGSSGTLEVSMRNKPAAPNLKATVGSKITLE